MNTDADAGFLLSEINRAAIVPDRSQIGQHRHHGIVTA